MQQRGEPHISCSVAPLGARLPARSTRYPGSVSGPRPSGRRSPRARSFPPRSPPRASPHCSTASQVQCPRPTPHPRACSSFGCCLHEPVRHALPDTDEASQVPYKGRLHVHGVSDCARLLIRKPFARGGCCLLVSELDRHLGIRPVSQLNTQPVVSPVNASGWPRGQTLCITRGRGGWLGLTPWKTCTSYPFASFPGASNEGQ